MGKWRDLGEHIDPVREVPVVGHLLVPYSVHCVENRETGELKEVIVGDGESLGKAVSEGRFVKKS